MESHRHARNPEVPTMSICGLGHLRPTSIALTTSAEQVTCPDCLAEMRACKLCGERINWKSTSDVAGEFWDPKQDDSVIAHAQCGLDAGLELA